MKEEDFVAFLLTKQPIVALVADRIEPLIPSQGAAMPVLTYQVIDKPRERSHTGPSGLAHPRIQLTCWSNRYLQAKDLAREVRVAIDGFRGQIGNKRVDAMLVVDEVDDYDAPTGRYRRIVDAIIWHEEATV